MEPNPETHAQFMTPQKKMVQHSRLHLCFLTNFFVFFCFLEHTSFPPTEAGLQVIDGSMQQRFVQIRQSTISDHVEILLQTNTNTNRHKFSTGSC